MESDKEEHTCFKTKKENSDIEITNLTYTQMFKLSVKLSKYNYKRTSLNLKSILNFLKILIKIIGEEITDIRNQWRL